MSVPQTLERNDILRLALASAVDRGFKVMAGKHIMAKDSETGRMYGYESIIFDPDFGKALWGEHEIQIEGMMPAWKYHIQQLSTTPDRINYLWENMP